MILDVLQKFKSGEITEKKAQQLIEKLKYNEYFQVLGNEYHFDKNRESLTGIPEVVFAQNKSAEDIKKIIFASSKNLLITKINKKKYAFFKESWDREKKIKFPYHYNEKGEVLYAVPAKVQSVRVLVIAAGTSDISIVEEIKCSLLFFGLKAKIHNDVGVAGLKRILHIADEIKKAKIIITVAGMEAALPSVVAGLTPAPVISVPSSVGYYGHFKGLTALLGMLGSCSPGIGVVNIDNGFGAVALVIKILNIKK